MGIPIAIASTLIAPGISSCLRPWRRSGWVISRSTRCPVSHRWTNVGSAKSPVPSITIRVGGGIERVPRLFPARTPARSEVVEDADDLRVIGILAGGLRLAELGLEVPELALDRGA